MNIAIDARVLEKGITGIGRYLSDVIKGIPKYDHENRYFLLSYSDISKADDFYSKITTGDSALPSKLYSPYWLNFILPKYLKRNKIDLFFSPNHLVPFNTEKNLKKIIVVHDTVHLIDKKYHPFLYRKYLDLALSKSIEKSDRIITISNNSKQDLIKYFSIPPEKIDVIYRTAEKEFQPRILTDSLKNELVNKFNLPEKFILYVGVIENRKNIIGILKIADALFEKNVDIKTVLIGRPGHGFKNINKEILKRKGYVKYINYMDDKSLKYTYNLAYVFLFPSYYEGFGLPPLEAMQSGVPVITSNTSSLPEVIDNSGFSFAPDDYSSYVEAINNLIRDNQLYGKMKEMAILQAQKFKIEETTKNLIEIFNSFNKSKPSGI